MHQALKELEKLHGKQSPDYSNPWVCLLYTTWYQPRQVNLAYWIARQLAPRVSGLTEPLEVVDFGSGTGALSIGLAAAFADLRGSIQPPGVTMWCIDTKAMYKSGGMCWTTFRRLLEGRATSPHRVPFRFEHRESAFDEDGNLVIDIDSKRSRWMVANHVLYAEGIEDVQWDLLALQLRLNPDTVCVSGPTYKREMIEISFPRMPETFTVTDIQPSLPQTGTLPGITNWRKQLNQQRLRRPHGDLNRSVTWAPRSPSGQPAVKLAVQKRV